MSNPARVLSFLLATVVTVAMGASAAWADAPDSPAWPDPGGRSVLGTLVFFGGGTIALYGAIALFGLLTARTNYTPPPLSTEVEKSAGNTPAHPTHTPHPHWE